MFLSSITSYRAEQSKTFWFHVVTTYLGNSIYIVLSQVKTLPWVDLHHPVNGNTTIHGMSPLLCGKFWEHFQNTRSPQEVNKDEYRRQYIQQFSLPSSVGICVHLSIIIDTIRQTGATGGILLPHHGSWFMVHGVRRCEVCGLQEVCVRSTIGMRCDLRGER